MEYHMQIEQGELLFFEEGHRVQVQVQAKNDRKGLYKAFLRGTRGQTLELGTLTPNGTGLSLRRTLPKEQLQQAGCWPPHQGYLTLAHRFAGKELPQGWQREENPAELLHHDPILCAALPKEGTALLCRNRAGLGFSLAFLYRADRPFPLTPLFCFARVRRLGQDTYAVYAFDPDGRPRR